MTCGCNKPIQPKAPQKPCGATPPVLEIKNEQCPILFHTVAEIDTSLDNPPVIGRYKNVLSVYPDGVWALYDSDGIYNVFASDAIAFNSLSGRPYYAGEEMTSETNIPDVEAAVSDEAGKRLEADNILAGDITSLRESLSTVAFTGAYADVSGTPTIGDATLTIKKNSTDVGTFTANATENATIDITVPTAVSELSNDAGYAVAASLATVATTGSFTSLVDQPVIDDALSDSSTNAVQNSVVTGALDRNVVTSVAVDPTASTTTVTINQGATNLKTGTSATTAVTLPVASTTQAGVMDSATFDAVTQNTSDINAMKNGSVAVTGISSSATQADITTAWQTATGFTTLINGARVYDVDNNKVWTYYTNDTTWHEASNTTQVTISPFTNGSEGTIKGSTNDGQIGAQNDGTGAVNGWSTLTNTVADHTSKLSTIAQGAEVNVQSDWSEVDSTSDAYIQNKPSNVSVFNNDAGYVTLTASTTDIGAGATLAAGTLYGVYS